MRTFPFFVLFSSLAAAQQTPSSSPASPFQQTVIVTGTPEPVMLADTPRAVVVLDTEQHPLAFETPEDYLRTDPSTFIEQRGAGGAQSDISIRGASFEQTLVLINGLRMNDSQASHHNLDLPIPLEAMRNIEILHGAGSTLYGSDALGGVINFLTATPEATSLTLRAGMGSFGENEQAATAAYVRKPFTQQLTATRNFSTGFIPDRDYRNETASSETRFSTPIGTTDILLAGSDRAFGADQFYGPYNSWERTKGWFSSIDQQFNPKTEAAFGYRRHADNFILFRDNPSYYANNHNDASWQAVLRRHDEITKTATLAYGLEFNGDSIDSNNLGIHARNQGAGYLNLDLRTRVLGRQATLTAGAREEILSGGERSVFSPDLAGSLWLTPSVKARASAGYGFRLPTYTDLYYTDPTTIGNANLKPESAWSADGGLDWYATSRTAASLTVFYSRQHDAIDYVRPVGAPQWQAANLTGLRFTGVEASLLYQPAKNQTLKLAWTLVNGAQKALHGLESQYIFNYPVNNASFEYTADVKRAFLVRTRLAITQRYQADPYPVWDTELTRERGRIRPYLRMANLSNTGYQEIQDIPMPGRSFTGGIELTLSR